jgi:hypothetical protein
MIFENPFRRPGRFFRGNTHTHSTESDGEQTVQERFEAYHCRGYDFLVMTDHFTVSDVSGCGGEGFLAMSGIELHPMNPYGGERYHFVGIGVTEHIDANSMEPNDVLAAVNEQGGVAVLAHPYWSGHTLSDYAELEGYIGLEVYNTTCCVSIAKGFSETHWDDMLDRLGPAVGLAVDDTHKELSDAFQGWVMVRAAKLTASAIIESLRKGAFYATQGPEIRDIRVEPSPEGPCLTVETSPVQRIALKARASNGACVDAVDGKLIECARCVMYPEHGYLRVEITGPDGKKAWSNPFFTADYL